MKMSEEMAVRLHRMMWSDMQRELGDNPNGKERAQFKFDWIHKRFPSESIANDCWLCEYAMSVAKPGDSEPYCKYCPISWPNCHCNTLGFSYAKEPISEILALPARNKKLTGLEATYIANDKETASNWYYQYREELLSKASGIPATSAIEDHVKAIKEKAVEEYFAKTPGAKLATMDVDEAFKQYADEQKAPIFRALAEASGLSAGNESVKAHISEIKRRAKISGRGEKCTEIINELSESSGLFIGNWHVSDHVKAIQEKAVKEMEPLKQMNDRLTKRHIEVKHSLAQESGLDHGRPVADHIKKIRDDAFSDGENAERERIQEKIEELLS